MAAPRDDLPEGTDSIVEDVLPEDGDVNEAGEGGAAETVEVAEAPEEIASAAKDAASSAAGAAQGAFAQMSEKASELRGQAMERARDVAHQGKERTADALENMTKLVDEAAGTIDEKVGTQYGDYARRAAEAVSSLASTLRARDVEDLLAEARDAVKKSPAIAIGAAATLGFIVARLVKAGTSVAEEPAPPPPARKAPGKKKPVA